MVHTFSVLGCNIAVDVNSGAVHVLDQLSYDLLSAAGENGEKMPILPDVDPRGGGKGLGRIDGPEKSRLAVCPDGLCGSGSGCPQGCASESLVSSCVPRLQSSMQILFRFHG